MKRDEPWTDAKYTCVECNHKWLDTAGSTQCNECGSIWVRWDNYEEMARDNDLVLTRETI